MLLDHNDLEFLVSFEVFEGGKAENPRNGDFSTDFCAGTWPTGGGPVGSLVGGCFGSEADDSSGSDGTGDVVGGGIGGTPPGAGAAVVWNGRDGGAWAESR